MPGGDTLAEPIIGAELRAEAADEKRASLSAIQRGETGVPHRGENGSSIDELSILPTREDLATLRRVPNKIPVKLFTIAFIELCERFSYYGSTVVCKSFHRQAVPDRN